MSVLGVDAFDKINSPLFWLQSCSHATMSGRPSKAAFDSALLRQEIIAAKRAKIRCCGKRCYSINTLPLERVPNKISEWNDHICLAEEARQQYRDAQPAARLTWQNTLEDERLPSAMISFDYAKKLQIPNMKESTMNEYFAMAKSYDVNLFGIVNEGLNPRKDLWIGVVFWGEFGTCS